MQAANATSKPKSSTEIHNRCKGHKINEIDPSNWRSTMLEKLSVIRVKLS